MKTAPIHLVFTGGGTGGHLIPGLAVAERIIERMPRARITLAGGGRPLERRLVSDAGFEHLVLPCRAMPRRWRDVLPFLRDNVAGYRAARQFIRKENVAAVVGLGGYASVPMARAAAARGLPLILLEQNVVPGKATRWLSRRASLVCAAFEQTAADRRLKCPVQVTGNPIRKMGTVTCFSAQMGSPDTLAEKARPLAKTLSQESPGGAATRGFVPEQGPLVAAQPRHLFRQSERSSNAFCGKVSGLPVSKLLILGGSGGARELNENVPRALDRVRRRLDGWTILHQSGDSQFESTVALYRRFDLPASVVPFVADVPAVLAATDLAVSRAGGTTLAELAAAGVPAVLLPYPHATDDHQLRNAEVFAAAGGSIVLDRCDRLAGTISELLGDRQRRTTMSTAMRGLAHGDAVAEVADLILQAVGHPVLSGPITSGVFSAAEIS
ncbi:MAG: UDP-N-acetylglucosamine--N-acetylmuramyl-(pentapeptide) pyrophosphoryl-undecaprenol N-acetylglucosamine transferase [Candidatus Nealsonbacteria bacterium]|nr:UDP-N-acetylglucosamine--N-acetylmuramyl-(pentapeptide) pyrophosphoryl-undecaprenol N-acetylglucosamine transferase [Candidatus Nealsonbacteria bacterium]